MEIEEKVLNAQKRLNKKLSLHLLLNHLYNLLEELNTEVNSIAIIRGYNHFYTDTNDIDCPYATKCRNAFENEMIDKIENQINEISELFKVYKQNK